MTTSERFWAKVEKRDICWLWRASIEFGYGQFRDANRRKVKAHRFSYELAFGPIPPGLEIDHLCRNKACVNPDHLEPVTHAENMRRGHSANRIKTHCKRGHEFTPENTYRRGHGMWRECRQCKADSRPIPAKKRDAP